MFILNARKSVSAPPPVVYTEVPFSSCSVTRGAISSGACADIKDGDLATYARVNQTSGSNNLVNIAYDLGAVHTIAEVTLKFSVEITDAGSNKAWIWVRGNYSTTTPTSPYWYYLYAEDFTNGSYIAKTISTRVDGEYPPVDMRYVEIYVYCEASSAVWNLYELKAFEEE